MAIKPHTYMGHTIWVGGYDLFSSPKGQPVGHGKIQKSQNKLIAQSIRQQNKARLRQASNHARGRV